MANHFAAMEIDGGAGHPLGINFGPKPEMKALLEPVAKILQDSGAGILSFSEHAGGADIGALTKQGVPGFSPIQDNRTYFHYHHTAADTLDKIVPRELADNAAVVAVTTYALANREPPLPRCLVRIAGAGEIDLRFPLLLRQENLVLGDAPEVAGETDFRQRPDDPFGGIEVPRFHTVAVVVLKLVVIVVITLAEREDRQEKGISRAAFCGIRLAAKN